MGGGASGQKIPSRKILDVVSYTPMNKTYIPLFGLLASLYGCSTNTSLTPGATLLSGMQQYQSEMQSSDNSPGRWPERQRLAGSLKTVGVATLGGSREFNRLVDLDLRKREFSITMRETSVKPDRLQEMKEELVRMNDEISALKPVVRAQIATLPVFGEGQPRVEGVATLGMLDLALESFAVSDMRGVEGRWTKVDQYLVTDLGSFSTVRAPDGHTFRCNVYSVPEEGGGVRCDPVGR